MGCCGEGGCIGWGVVGWEVCMRLGVVGREGCMRLGVVGREGCMRCCGMGTLPKHIKTSDILANFKHRLKTNFFNHILVPLADEQSSCSTRCSSCSIHCSSCSYILLI